MKHTAFSLRKGSSRKWLRDLCLILCLCLVALGIFLGSKLFSPSGSYAEVRLGKTLIGKYPLSKDAAVPIDAGNGESNFLIISNGCAYIKEATCPDKICVRHRPISRIGESILCLPHSLSVTVTGENAAESGADFVQ